MTERSDGRGASIPDTVHEIERLLRKITKVPWQWLVAMIVAAGVTSVDVSRSSGNAISVHIHVGVLALVALALIWLPALIRVLVLTGGSLQAGALTASTGGLLNREDLVELLARVKGVTAGTEASDTRESAIRELDDYADRLAADHLDGDRLLTREQLRSLAVRYERLRQDSPPGPRRTSDMTRIVNETRARAASSPQSAGESSLTLLGSSSQGDRIVGLALVQESREVTALEGVLRLVTNSATAFEMFHALIAIQELSLELSAHQRTLAADTLVSERQDPRGVGINDDPALPSLIERTLADLLG